MTNVLLIAIRFTHFSFPIGDILTVNCSAQGDQTLRVAWSREYAELPDHTATIRRDGTLIITQIVPEDAGKYFCIAIGVGGAITVTADMNLIVVESKWHYLLLSPKLGPESFNTKISCST